MILNWILIISAIILDIVFLVAGVKEGREKGGEE